MLHLWWMKELRQVKMSSGTMAHRVITLSNIDSKTLRVLPPTNVPLRFWASAFVGGSLRRLVKYCEEIIQQTSSICINNCPNQSRLAKRFIFTLNYKNSALLPWWQSWRSSMAEAFPAQAWKKLSIQRYTYRDKNNFTRLHILSFQYSGIMYEEVSLTCLVVY